MSDTKTAWAVTDYGQIVGVYVDEDTALDKLSEIASYASVDVEGIDQVKMKRVKIVEMER
jgi:antirestriction protein